MITYNDIRIYTEEQLKKADITDEELKAFKPTHATPLLDELEKGPWPSLVSDFKRQALHRKKLGQENLMIPEKLVDDLLGLVELSFKEKETHWKHGGIVGVLGYGGGIVGRYSDQQATFPNVAHFHTIRINQPRWQVLYYGLTQGSVRYL